MGVTINRRPKDRFKQTPRVHRMPRVPQQGQVNVQNNSSAWRESIYTSTLRIWSAWSESTRANECTRITRIPREPRVPGSVCEYLSLYIK